MCLHEASYFILCDFMCNSYQMNCKIGIIRSNSIMIYSLKALLQEKSIAKMKMHVKSIKFYFLSHSQEHFPGLEAFVAC